MRPHFPIGSSTGTALLLSLFSLLLIETAVARTPSSPRSATLNVGERSRDPQSSSSDDVQAIWKCGAEHEDDVFYAPTLREELLTHRPNDFTPVAAGSIFVVHVFVDDGANFWVDDMETESDGDRAKMAKKAKEAFDWLAGEAPAAADLLFSNHTVGESYNVYWYDVDLDPTLVPTASGGTQTWMHAAAESLGFGDQNSSNTAIDEMLEFVLHTAEGQGYEWAIVLFHPAKDGRSWARKQSRLVSSNNRYGCFGVVYPKMNGTATAAAVMAHEMTHLFGAKDEYEENDHCAGGIDCGVVSHRWLEAEYENGNCAVASCQVTTVWCLMRSGHGSLSDYELCDYTRGQIGWEDEDSDGTIDLAEMPPHSWLDGSHAAKTKSLSLTVNARAWSPHSEVSNLQYQINTAVVDTEWVSVSSPVDGSYNEHDESFSFPVSLSGEGTHTIWLRAQNGDGVNQQATLASHAITVDTTPPPAPPASSAATCYPPGSWTRSSTVKVCWTESPAGGVVGWGVGLDTNAGTAAPNTITTTTSSYSFSPGGTADYYVHVAAVDDVGNWSPTSHFRVMVDMSSPMTPLVTSTTHTNGAWSNVTTATFDWSALDLDSGVHRYRRSISLDSTTVPTYATSDTAVTWDLRSLSGSLDGTHYVHVRAEDAVGNLGPVARFEMRIHTQPPTQPAPQSDPLSGNWIAWTGPIDVFWEPAASPLQIDGYSVNLVTGTVGSPPNEIVDVTDTTYTSSGLASGRHTFGVRARDEAGNWSSPVYLPIAIDNTEPSAVENLHTTSHSNALGGLDPWESADAFVDIVMDAATDPHSGVSYYLVLWSTDSTLIPTEETATEIGAGTSYVSPELSTDQWYVMVRAVDAVGNVGSTVKLGPIYIDTTPPSPPANLQASSGNQIVNLTWTASPDPDVQQYYVYRSKTAGAVGSPVDSTTATLYPDTGLLNGDIYYYRVAAQDSVGLVSDPTDEAIGRPEYMSPGNSITFNGLAQLASSSAGGVRAVGDGTYTMHGTVTIALTDQLALSAGETLRSTDMSGSRVLRIHGALSASGTAGDPVLLEAVSHVRGAWGGVDLAVGPGAVGTSLQHVVVRYGVNNVLLDGCNITISDCELTHALENGLVIAGLPSVPPCMVTVQNNTIQQCDLYGIWIGAASNSLIDLSGNLISQNGSGIWYYWSPPRVGEAPDLVDIYSNTIRGNTSDGIRIGYSGETTLIHDNFVHRNARGIVFQEEGAMIALPVISNNEISANSVAGVYVSSMAQPEVLRNRIVANPSLGVHSQEASPRLRDNTIQGSNIGVLVDQSPTMVPDLGAGGTNGHNRLDAHTSFYVQNLAPPLLQAVGNYWGAAQANPAPVISGPVNFMPTWVPPNAPPSIGSMAVAETSPGTATITWTDQDADSGDTLVVALFYDVDAVGLDGTGIDGASSIDGWDQADTFVWSLNTVPAGTYYVYGVISDGTDTDTSYSAGTVVVEQPVLTVVQDSLSTVLSRDQASSLTLDIRNDGTDTMTVGFSVDEVDGGGWLAVDPGPLQIAPMAGPDPPLAVVVDVGAHGLDDGNYNGRVLITSDDPASSLHLVPVTLTVLHPDLSASADSVSLGSMRTGSSTLAMVLVTNPGTAPVTLSTLFELAPPFQADLLDSTLVEPDSLARIRVQADPDTRGAFLDTLVISGVEDWEPSVTVIVTANGVGPALVLPDSVHDFGAVVIGDTASWSLPIGNVGEDTLVVNGVAPTATAFRVALTGLVAVAPGETALVTVDFVPSAANSILGSLTLAHNDPAGPGSVSLTGSGQGGIAAFGDTGLAFGGVTLGDSATAIAWLHNLGNAGFQVASAEVDSPFVLVSTGSPWSVDAGDSLALTVLFAPTAAGAGAGNLGVATTDALLSSPTVDLTGTGLEPALACDVDAIDLGTVEVGDTVQTTFKIRSTREGTVRIDGVLAIGDRFEIGSPVFPVSIPGFDSAEVTIQFSPNLVGSRVDTLFVTPAFELLDTCVVVLQGSGAVPQPVLSTLAYSFGPVLLGESAVLGIEFENQGGIPAEVELLAPGAPFTLQGALATIPPFGQEDALVSFSPTAASTWVDSVVVRWGAPPATLGVVVLDGEGVEPDLAAPLSQIVVDVFEDSVADTILTLINQGTGVVAFSLVEMGEIPASAAAMPEFTVSTFKSVAGANPGSAGKRWPGGGLTLVAGVGSRAHPGGLFTPQSPSLPCEPATAAQYFLSSAYGKAIGGNDIPWADLTVSYDYVCPDSTADIQIDLASTGYAAGIYDGRLELLTSDATLDSVDIGLTMRVPRMRFATHDAGKIRLTVTDEGALGFFDADQLEFYGEGLQWPTVGSSHIFHGSLFLGDGPNRVVDACFDYDFSVDPGFELRMDAGPPQSTYCRFTDGLAPNPLGVEVEQYTYAYAGDPDADYVLLDYAFTASAARPGVYVGLWLDPDIGNFMLNSGGYDSDHNLGYLFATDGSESTRVGVSLLAGGDPVSFRLINNATFTSLDSVYWVLTTSGILDSIPPTPSDYSILMSVGPLNLGPSHTNHVVLALVTGGSQSTLLAAADAARERFPDVVTGIDPGGIPSRLILRAPYPNPARPGVGLQVEVPPPGGNVRLEVFDLAGRRVRTVGEGHRDPGRWTMTWDGKDSHGRWVASGVYFLRVVGLGMREARKIVMMR